MKLNVHTARGALFALATGAALAFGASTALARPTPAATCTEIGTAGTCQSTSDCRKICNRLSNGLIPFCDTRTSCCSCQKL